MFPLYIHFIRRVNNLEFDYSSLCFCGTGCLSNSSILLYLRNITSFGNRLQGFTLTQIFLLTNVRTTHSCTMWSALHVSLFLSSQTLKALICSQCCFMSLVTHWASLTPHPATQWWGPTTRVQLGTPSITAWDHKIWSTSPSSMVNRHFAHLCTKSQNVNFFHHMMINWLPGENQEIWNKHKKNRDGWHKINEGGGKMMPFQCSCSLANQTIEYICVAQPLCG